MNRAVEASLDQLGYVGEWHSHPRKSSPLPSQIDLAQIAWLGRELEATAMRALDIAFASPAARIKIEFQGGEPLLNFPMIKTIVAAAKARSGKKVDFVIASNLALLDDAVLTFCKANNILLSTSLDGPADLHNKNRPRPGGNSHELAASAASAACRFRRPGSLPRKKSQASTMRAAQSARASKRSGTLGLPRPRFVFPLPSLNSEERQIRPSRPHLPKAHRRA